MTVRCPCCCPSFSPRTQLTTTPQAGTGLPHPLPAPSRGSSLHQSLPRASSLHQSGCEESSQLHQWAGRDWSPDPLPKHRAGCLHPSCKGQRPLLQGTSQRRQDGCAGVVQAWGTFCPPLLPHGCSPTQCSSLLSLGHLHSPSRTINTGSLQLPPTTPSASPSAGGGL